MGGAEKMKPPKKHPRTTALEDWPEGWLKLEVANLTKYPSYIVMTDEEKREVNYPVTVEEMRQYIRNKKK
jgi:hypothetical protein